MESTKNEKKKLNKNSSNQKKSHLGFFLIYLKGKKILCDEGIDALRTF